MNTKLEVRARACLHTAKPRARTSRMGLDVGIGQEPRMAARLAWVQRIMLVLGLGLVSTDAVIELVHRGHIRKHAVSLAKLPAKLVALHGGGIFGSMLGLGVARDIATSMYMVAITVSASAFLYYNHGLIDPSVAVPALLGVAIGSQLGARVGRPLHSRILTRLLVLILLGLAVVLLLQLFGVQLPGTPSSN